MSYNPVPPRVWSRVQHPCTFNTAQNMTQTDIQELKQLYKGNILQHKANSARLSKSQKYAQLAKCMGPSRTKVYATQSQTYTNPNTTGLLRQNYTTYTFPNQLVGAPNNPSGPFAYGMQNPDGCAGYSVQDGGTLVCGTYANPCSGAIVKQGTASTTICNPASASNVPGTAILCWKVGTQTWFPRQTYFMNNSTDKWPVNYKGFVRASNCLRA